LNSYQIENLKQEIRCTLRDTWDPLCVSKMSSDEYDCYVDRVLKIAIESDDTLAIENYLNEIIIEYMNSVIYENNSSIAAYLIMRAKRNI